MSDRQVPAAHSSASTYGGEGRWSLVRLLQSLVMYEALGARSDKARVRAVSENGRRLYLEYPSGQIAATDWLEPPDLPVGTVVLVRADENHIEPAPSAVWPEESWIGVVRLRLDDITVVDTSGRLRSIRTNTVDYHVRNTVEGKDTAGVLRVLDPNPIRFIDLPGIDDTVVESFRVKDADGLDFDAFGGFKDVVARARELIERPFQRADLLGQIGAKPVKGVLLTGAPGTGKTMLARIIASRAEAAFYEIRGPEVFSKWYGESEELLRKIFEAAARHERAIVFFDEIDSVAVQRDSDAHEASRRVVAQLLTLMDGFKADDNVVVVATTNRPQDIDVALRRPGRFDWEIHFPLPSILDRREILEVSSRRLATEGPLPHAHIAEHTASWSSADLTAIWTEAALLAVAEERPVIMADDYVAGHARVAAQRARIGPGPKPVRARDAA